MFRTLIMFLEDKDLFTLFAIFFFGHGQKQMDYHERVSNPIFYAILTLQDLTDSHALFGHELLNHPVYKSRRGRFPISSF